jgi:hypothetical protein
MQRCASGVSPLFDSFFLAGFECSDHRLDNGRRLDLLASTRHDELVESDYARLRALDMSACRDGVSWVRVEPQRGVFDFTSFLPRLRAARQLDLVAWDLMHFGYPDHVDVFAIDFPARFADYARALAHFMAEQACCTTAPMFSLINEMSFYSWAAGDMACMFPFALARGDELKVQLVLATIAGIHAIREVFPAARFLHAEPLIQVLRSPEHVKTWRKVECDNRLQYEALDMLAGRCWLRLGGDPSYLDVVGLNYYPDNQFMLDGTTVRRGDPRYRPLSELLIEAWQHYQRPMIISETGSEGDERGAWLAYVAEECLIALEHGCELHGVTLYPILDHPGWVDDRYCPNGLWGYADHAGQRVVHEELAQQLLRYEPLLRAARERALARRHVANTAHAESVHV